jgi:hypothetical protein
MVRFVPVGGAWPPPWAYRSELINGGVLHRGPLGAVPSIDRRARRMPFELLRWDTLTYGSGLVAVPTAFGISVPAVTLDRRWGVDVVDAINLAQGFMHTESG